MIRDLERKDMKWLAKLYEQFWGEQSDIGSMCELFDRISSRKDYILLGAEEDGKLAGSVTGIVCEEMYGTCEPFLVLENMVVDQGCRRRGIGKALLEEMEARARVKGCRQVILVTESDRMDACGFYVSAGFHPTANAGFKKKL